MSAGGRLSTAESAAAIGLQPIAIRVDHEGGVVVFAVIGAKAWFAIALAASGQCGLVKGINGLSRRRVEAKMQP